ncbi:MAG: gluconate 2-dehydrogenase subunit 3 family protein [Bacteroidota bacterium]
MKRREALKKTALLMGYAVSASAITGVMSGCQADTKTPADQWQPQIFSDLQISTLREAAERILPRTEGIVGAKDVMVERFADKMYHSFYKPEQATNFKAGLDQLEMDAKSVYNKSFANLSNEQMDEMITALMEKAKANQGATGADTPFFFPLKEITLLGFYTSEQVGEKVLNYDPVPTAYDGCMPLENVPNGRTWSS